ncbi:MAG: hypothetical protein ABFC42_09190 [Sulfuricella sp.]
MPTPDEISRRFDAQDETLSKILQGMAEHREYHKLTDPGVSEVVDMLKGAKAVKVVITWAVGITATCAGAWAWLGDHIRLLK